MTRLRTGAVAGLAMLSLGIGPSASETPPPPIPLPADCAGRTDVLGLSRVVEIDTTLGPRFGHGQYKDNDFLQDGEVVLTFDDGPLRRYTLPILDALDAQCTRATFFTVGRMALADPGTLKETARRGHTIGVHTWSHKNLTTVTEAAGRQEIELGISAVTRAMGAPVAPFFRFPYLRDTKPILTYLAGRNLGVYSIDVDSRDFSTRNPAVVKRNVLDQLSHTKKGIILFHDIQPSTAGALPSLLAELKARGFRVVHLLPKGGLSTLADFDTMLDKVIEKGRVALAANPGAGKAVTRPLSQDVPTPHDPATGEPPTPPRDGETLPWLALPAPASSPAAESAGSPAPMPQPVPQAGPRPVRRPDWRALDDDPWQIRALGN